MRPIYVNNVELIKDKKSSFLNDDIASGVSSFDVDSILGFAVNQNLLIMEPGNEYAELVKTHASTAPTGNTITLASATQFAHIQGIKIYIIDWDQIEFSWGASDTSTVVLDTIAIQADSVDTQYSDDTYSTGNYFVRFKNTIPTPDTYSDYSDPIPWGGYDEDTVGSIIAYAMKRNKMGDYTDNVDHQFCVDEINSCLKIIRGKLKKWHSLQSFDYKLGTTTQGLDRFSLPTDMWKYSNKSVLSLKIGLGEPLTYKDKREWNHMMSGVAHTTLSASAIIGATTITLTEDNDFGDSGSLMINGQVITYTALDRTTNVASGIPASGTGAILTAVTSGDNVWQGSYEQGEAAYFTIIEGYALIWPMPTSSYAYRNVLLDYWKEAPSIETDNDAIEIMRFDMVKFWLVWVIRSQLKNDGMRDINDGDYVMFLQLLSDAIRIELRTSGQKYKTKPLLNQIKF